MFKLITLCLLISGCTTNGVYDSKKTWLAIGTVVVAGALLSSSDSYEDCETFRSTDGNLYEVCKK